MFNYWKDLISKPDNKRLEQMLEAEMLATRISRMHAVKDRDMAEAHIAFYDKRINTLMSDLAEQTAINKKVYGNTGDEINILMHKL